MVGLLQTVDTVQVRTKNPQAVLVICFGVKEMALLDCVYSCGRQQLKLEGSGNYRAKVQRSDARARAVHAHRLFFTVGVGDHVLARATIYVARQRVGKAHLWVRYER